MKITEIDNKLPKNINPIKEVMSFHIPDIDEALPNKNGFIWFICGSAGSGKSSMLMNLFKATCSRLHRAWRCAGQRAPMRAIC